MDSESTISIRIFVRNIQKRAIVSGMLIGLLLVLLWSRPVGFGFWAGAVVSIINFQLMAVDVFAIADKAPKKALIFIIGRFALRFSIMFGFIVLIILRTEYNIVATFIGLFFVQTFLVIGHVFRSININNRIFKSLQ